MRVARLAIKFLLTSAMHPARITSFVLPRPQITYRPRNLSSFVCLALADLITREQIQALGEGQAVVIDGVFDTEFVQALAADVSSIDDKCFTRHTTGRSPNTQRLYGDGGQRIRGDLAGWFDSNSSLDSLALLWRFFDYLRVFLNEEALLSLRRQDCQLARFPGDGISTYPKHIDAVRDKRGANRQITAIVYLNDGWVLEDGGCLRVWNGKHAIDIAPALNRLVLFRSNLVAHEVLPSAKTRHAASVWFYDGGSAG
jgi:SM-20-related protein